MANPIGHWQFQTFVALFSRPYATAVRSRSSRKSREAVSRPDPTSITSDFVEKPAIQDEASEAHKMRTYKPRTPGLRHLKRPINDHLWKGRAYLPLTYPRKGHGIGGRNYTGKISMRHRGGGVKRRIRIVDFTRDAPGPHTVERIEYDPGRSAHIALITNNETNEKSYILAAEGMREGDIVQSYRQGIPKELIEQIGGVMDMGMIAAKTAWRGNCLPLRLIPAGTFVYNVGLKNKGKGQLCRGAGTFGQIVATQDNEESRSSPHIPVRLQSGEVRLISKHACATIGIASNPNHNRAQLGKAGRSRLLGIRPTVRGVAMNANEHPHGGGRGKSKGNVHPVSIWGQLTKSGFKTRTKSKSTKHVMVARPRSMGRKNKKKTLKLKR
ncbi:hypothetical protein MMC25_005125 [Agyrium rufum]|nr:hypothetical protein [Agyrium rufum]